MTEQLHRGYVHPSTGLVFWAYWSPGKPRWLTPENFSVVQSANKVRQSAYYESHKGQSKANGRRWYDANKQHAIELVRAYQLVHKKHLAKAEIDRRKRLMETDPIFNLKRTLRSRLSHAHRALRVKKSGGTMEFLGCSMRYLMEHLQGQFKPGMHWLNHGIHGWHIDHIFPVASASTLEDIRRLFHYTNLQPLWWWENHAKGATIP